MTTALRGPDALRIIRAVRLARTSRGGALGSLAAPPCGGLAFIGDPHNHAGFPRVSWPTVDPLSGMYDWMGEWASDGREKMAGGGKSWMGGRTDPNERGSAKGAKREERRARDGWCRDAKGTIDLKTVIPSAARDLGRQRTGISLVGAVRRSWWRGRASEVR